MRLRASFVILTLAFCGCQPDEQEGNMKAIVGAVLIDGQGGPPVSDSAVVVAGERIREVGAENLVTIPPQAGKVDGAGRFVTPSPIDIYPSAEAARGKSRAAHVSQVDKAALAAARDAGIPIIGHVSTQAEVRALVDGGAAGFVGMITDTENLDPALVARLRDLKIFFAPALVSQGAALEVAKRNTRRLFAAGVPIALASNGGDVQREPELLQEAGLPPLDIIVAITRNSAAALGQLPETGTIEAGKQADLLLLSANPGEDVRNLRKIVLRLSRGVLQK